MKKIFPTYIFRLIAAAVMIAAAAACSDEADIPAPDEPGSVVTLCIPNPSAAAESARSRGADPDPSSGATEGEGAIRSLWLLAYSDDAGKNVIRRLESSGQLTHEYSEYKVEFKPGDYRIYVVANLDSYISKAISASTSEEELQSLILNFSAEKLPNLSDGLPMACLPAEIDGAGTDGKITVSADENRTISADLTFLCAKVRYTILFDNTAPKGNTETGGFSRPAFGDKTVTFTGASLDKVIASTALTTPATTSATGAFSLDTAPLAAVDASEGTKRAWQGTIYLPENLLSGKDRTLLLLDATLDDTDTQLGYTVTLPGKKDGAQLQRGKFYDLEGRVTTIGDRIEMTANVADWTLQTLTYDLHGPYFLRVDKTTIEVTAGLETRLEYDTDVDINTLKFESPEYEGKQLFVCKTVKEDGKNYIVVTVNPEINAKEGTQFNSYFDIIAANLHKRINVTPVHLDPFLNVSPTEIEINVGEYIASGEYTADIPITYSTNLNNVTITGYGITGWDTDAINLDGYTDRTDKEGTNTLKLTGMNGGTFWKSEHTLTLTYTATGANNTTLTKTVTITIKPNILDYVIHLRVPESWNMPHIYVYQCLQFPADLQDQDNIPYSDRRSKPVGQSENLAALEYAFTSKIAFKGWKGYGGPDINNPYEDGDYKKGFFVFSSSQTYDPTNSNRYFQEMDFSATHRKDNITACSTCANGNNNLWPGICMIKESDGWWKYTLTGIATPGKALIMFTNAHNNNETDVPRYPDDQQVGIPLFDYPSREGWFDYSNFATQFSPTKPGSLFRLEWSKTDDLWKISIQDTDTGLYVGNTSEYGQTYSYVDDNRNLFGYNFLLTENVKSIKVTLIDGNNTIKRSLPITINVSDFTGDNPKYYWIGTHTLDNVPVYTYRIYWKDTGWDRCHVWATINGSDIPNPSAPTWNSIQQAYSGTEYRNNTTYRYFQFSSTQNWYSDKYSFILYNSSNQNDKKEVKNQEFTKNNSIDNSYDYYYEYN